MSPLIISGVHVSHLHWTVMCLCKDSEAWHLDIWLCMEDWRFVTDFVNAGKQVASIFAPLLAWLGFGVVLIRLCFGSYTPTSFRVYRGLELQRSTLLSLILYLLKLWPSEVRVWLALKLSNIILWPCRLSQCHSF